MEYGGWHEFTPADRVTLCGAVTGIGSLPLVDPDVAVESVVAHCPEIPFWPQLPRRSVREGIIGQALGSLADLIQQRPSGFGYQVLPGKLDAVLEQMSLGSGELDRAHAAGFSAFTSALGKGRFPQAQAVKGQIEGPISLACYLYAGDRPFVADPSLYSAVCEHVTSIVQWQIAQLRRMGHPVLFFVDEPALCLAPAGARLDLLAGLWSLLEAVRDRGAMAGLHCCAAQPFDPMCQVQPDILSFDAYNGLEAFFGNANARAFLREGGLVAYGLIPTTASVHEISARALLARWLVSVSRFGDICQVARQAMVTATCGLGLLEEAMVAPSFSLAHEVGAQLRQLGLEMELVAVDGNEEMER